MLFVWCWIQAAVKQKGVAWVDACTVESRRNRSAAAVRMETKIKKCFSMEFHEFATKIKCRTKKRSLPQIGTDFSWSFVMIAITRHFFV